MDHRTAWRREADRFADVLVVSDLSAQVPGCPDWTVADLAFHVGWVYDRFRRVVEGRLTDREQVREMGAVERPADDAALPGWFPQQVDGLAAALAGLDDDEPLWNFTRAPHVGAWLPRRMHHETVVHRHDLEEAAGLVTAIEPDVARDGVDEFLTVLSTAGTRWDQSASVVFRVEEVSGESVWQVQLDPGERATVVDESAPADVTIRGEPVELLLAVWRRAPLSSVGFSGDDRLAKSILEAMGR